MRAIFGGPPASAINSNGRIAAGISGGDKSVSPPEAPDKSVGHTSANGKSAIEGTSDGTYAVDDSDWFAVVAEKLHPQKTGTILFLTTGLGDERTCQRYAAAATKPSAYFFRRLLRSKGGWQWLCGAMDGCEEQWWRDVHEWRRKAEIFDRAVAEAAAIRRK